MHDGLIYGNRSSGIVAMTNSSLAMECGTIIDNGAGGQYDGILARDSNVVINGGVIEGSSRHGIQITGSSGMRPSLDMGHGGAVHIVNNQAIGVFAVGVYIYIHDITIEYNGSNGMLFDDSIVTMRNGIIQGNGGRGVSAQRGSIFTMYNGLVHDNANYGVTVFFDSTFTMHNGAITDNGHENIWDGLRAIDSTVVINNGTISGSGRNGIFIQGRDAWAYLTIQNIHIEGNNNNGIDARDATVRLYDGQVRNNGLYGIQLWLYSRLYLNGGSVESNTGPSIRYNPLTSTAEVSVLAWQAR